MKKPYKSTGSRIAKDLTCMTHHPNGFFFQLVFATHSSKLRNHLPRYWSHWSTNSSTVLDHPLPSIPGWEFPSVLRLGGSFLSQQALGLMQLGLLGCYKLLQGCKVLTSSSNLGSSTRPTTGKDLDVHPSCQPLSRLSFKLRHAIFHTYSYSAD